MLAQSPGGLKLALPDLSIFNKQNSNRETISMYTNITNINDHTSVKAQLDQTIQFDSRVYPSVLTKPDISSYLPSDTSTAITSGGKVITVSDALNKLSFTKSNSNEIIKSSMEIIETAIKPVFLTNSRLREMTEHLTSERITGYYPVTKEEICHCIERVLIKLNTTINISQSEALIGALSRPLSLIQGPPGTGKTRTAGLILTTLIEIYNTRMKQGGFLAKGIKVNRILACAHSNLASDNILEQLILANIKVVRIGRPVNIHTSLWNYTLDCLLDNEYEYKIAKQNLNLAFKFLSETVPELTDGKSITQLKKDIATYKKELAEVEQACVYRILNDADVIVSTCIGAGSDILRDFVETYGLRFSTVLIDEACQSAESNLFPTLVYGCERLILVGDQNQLPPFVSSPLALEQGLGISLFARLISGGLEPYLLTEQYRMHPDIANFSSTEFYSGKVKTAIAKEDRPIPKGFNWPNMNIPVAFIDICPKSVTRNNPDKLIYSDLFEHINDDSQDIEEELNQIYKSNKRINRPKRSDGLSSGFELQSKASNSYCNLAEAQVVIKIIRQLISVSDISLSDIGVISPYNGQVREVTKRCREIGWTVDASTDVNIVSNFKDNSIIKPDKPPKQEFNDTNNKVENIWSDISSRKVSADLESDEDTTLSLDNNLDSYLVTSEDTYNSTSQIFNQLEIKSIDGYQGREKEVIILTAVRSNPNKSLGFLSDWRRLNVAVTRGKRGLIVIGDSTTLSNDIHWGNFIDWCRSNSCYKLDNEMLNISELRQQIIDYKNNSKNSFYCPKLRPEEMSSLKWVPLRRNYSIEREKYKLESSSTASHPLQPKKQRQTVVVTEIKIKSSGNVKQLVNIQDPLSNRLYDPLTNSLDPLSDPLSSKKDFNDPLSDPLSNISLTVNMSSNDDSVQNTTSNNKITWNVKKQQILKDYAMIGNISLSSSAINDFSGSGVEDGSSTKRVDKYTERLASLEKKDDLVTLTQKEYEDHINKLHSDLVKAWGNDERVGSLKIAIQLAKLLSDTNVPKFYPCMFVMVTDILVKFSDMVYNRLKNKAEEVLNENNSSKKRITLPFDFTSSDVPLSAKETTRNW
eukprot:CAMPEP_0196768398 /NCGR_PEP_ID=MMETSP1095-20130614/42699_1 /TAXON_ID=96789 ORGANISM="Chromulina nebulosa, Strain UTEXLB2642" /NCGR_SAMPLE_ID=MMETSP1095 /ASSEMBLY_ACC=CAM_ASM_000446 /LENGTH=1091 /DNA_ID=CAMNT_0042137929 /DNA_START=656 /DNA_END=3929 /DNA_ORIENTATION=+